MTLNQLARRVKQLGYHLSYRNFVEEKIEENTALIKQHLISEGLEQIAIARYRVTLQDNELKLERLPETEFETISIFEFLEEAS